jgi:hypothetical protein
VNHASAQLNLLFRHAEVSSRAPSSNQMIKRS